MKKKFLSLVLACSLMVGSLPFAAYADDATTPTTEPTSTSQTVEEPYNTGSDTVQYTSPTAAKLRDTRTDSNAIADEDLYDSYSATVNDHAIAIKATGLKQHQNSKGDMGYWVGAAFIVPIGSASHVKCVASFDESKVTDATVADATAEAVENIETADSGTMSGFSVYTDGDTHKNDTLYVGVQWMNGETNVGTVQIYTVTFAGVEKYTEPAPSITYPAPVAAILEDKADQPLTKLYETYELTAEGNDLTISATGLQKHTNDNKVEAYWVGAAFPAPEDATHYCMAADWSAVTEDDLGSPDANIANVTADGKSGAAIYTDGVKHKNDTLYVGIQWVGNENVPVGDTQFYTITFADVQAYVATTGISLNKETLTMVHHDTAQLVATVAPANATNKAVTWTSSDDSSVTVDKDGNLKAYKVTTAPVTITATCGEFSATCAVTVNPKAVTGITLNKTAVTLASNETYQLDETVTPVDASNRNVTWSSSDNDVATVDQYGEITAVANGTATITATTVDGSKTATCAVTVKDYLGNFVVTANSESTAYDTIEEAVAALTNGSTLTLNADAEVKNKIVIDKSITITTKDTGAAIASAFGTAMSVPEYVLQIEKGATLNLTGDALSVENKTTTPAIWVHGGTLNADCQSIYAEVKTAIGVTDGGICNVLGDTEITSGVAAIVAEGGTVNIKGGYLGIDQDKSSLSNPAVTYATAGGTLNISGGIVDGQALATANGTLNITGGIIYEVGARTFNEDQTAIVNISGGEMGELKKAGGSGTETITVTGGIFHADPTDCIASGYKVTEGTDENGYPIWTVSRQYSGGGGGGGSSSKKDNTTTEQTKQDEVKQEEVTTPETIAPGEATTENIGRVFSDTKSSDWYAEAAAYAYNNGLMQGDENGNFGGNDSATRGQIVTILHRLAGEPDAGDAKFNDVKGTEYYADAVAWAATNGLVNGYEDGTFSANGDVTREELATILYRFASAQGWVGETTGALTGFSDGDTTSEWATEALAWAVSVGLLQGNDDGTLNPGGNATRAEIATILMRFCENIAK